MFSPLSILTVADDEVNKDILITKTDRTKKREFQGNQNFNKKKTL
jgi:hypothetical protein